MQFKTIYAMAGLALFQFNAVSAEYKTYCSGQVWSMLPVPKLMSEQTGSPGQVLQYKVNKKMISAKFSNDCTLVIQDNQKLPASWDLSGSFIRNELINPPTASSGGSAGTGGPAGAAGGRRLTGRRRYVRAAKDHF